MTLDKVAMGALAEVRDFRDLSVADVARLAGLGLRRGSAVTKLLRTPLRDPVECLVGPQLLTLDSWLLKRILVEPS